MMRRIVIVLIYLVFLSGCAKNRNTVVPQLPLDYLIGSIEYHQTYGDAVHVSKSDNEFVICSSCPNISGLERLPAKIPVVIRFSNPPLPATVNSGPITTSESYVPASTDLSNTDSAAQPTTVIQEKSAKDMRSPGCQSATVYFSLNSAALSLGEQQNITKSLGTFQRKKIEVHGYTCDLGNKPHNDRLALARAEAVAKFLKANGVSSISASGEGKCCYVSQDRALNRRAEIHCSEGTIEKGGNDGQ